VGQLTNWYVRLNRERLKAEGEDSVVALQVLHSVLVDMTLILSPFTPFITEFFYQHLRKFQPSYALSANGGGKENPVMFGKSDSVHFLRLPEYDPSRLNAVAVKAMGVLQTVVELGRLGREKRLLSLKQPVKSLVICVTASEADVVENLKNSLDSYIRSELNVWDVKYVTREEEHEWVTISLLPNLAILGKKLGKSMGLVTKYLKEMKHEDAKAAVAAGQATVEGIVIDFKTEIIVQYKYAREGDKIWEGCVNEAGSVMIAIDTTQDEALLSAGKSRELITTVQKLRKAAKLTLSDKVDVFYKEPAGSNSMRSAIASNMPTFEAKFGVESIPLPVEFAEKHSLVIATSTFETMDAVIEVELRTPVLCVRDDLDGLLKSFLAGKELATYKSSYSLSVDGTKFEIKDGADYWGSSTAKARSNKKI
jgi:isoleucyl-tRNA synthetase